MLSEDGRRGGGAYLWRSRTLAEPFYGDEFRHLIRERYGSTPHVRFFETPVLVDNEAGTIVTADAVRSPT
jgi:hypothetical protein